MVLIFIVWKLKRFDKVNIQITVRNSVAEVKIDRHNLNIELNRNHEIIHKFNFDT